MEMKQNLSLDSIDNKKNSILNFLIHIKPLLKIDYYQIKNNHN